MSSCGIDRQTGKPLSGWDHVEQSIGVLLTTRYFERVLREYVGSPVPALLGETANPQTVLKFRWAIALAILLFEPRFLPRTISMPHLDRSGASEWLIVGGYRPRAHVGDFTVAGTVTLKLGQSGSGLIISN